MCYAASLVFSPSASKNSSGRVDPCIVSRVYRAFGAKDSEGKLLPGTQTWSTTKTSLNLIVSTHVCAS